MTRRRAGGWLGLALCAALAGAAGAQAPDPRLAKELSVEARAAAVDDLAVRLGRAVGVSLEADPVLAGRRVTLIAPKTTVAGLQAALAALYRTAWRPLGPGPAPGYRLQANRTLEEAARRLSEQRRAAFLARLVVMGQSLRPRTEGATAAAVRADVARRQPVLPPDAVAAITPEYLRQTVLMTPVRQGMFGLLLRTGSALTPLAVLPPEYQRLFGEFFREQFQSAAPAGATPGLAEAILSSPRARLDYRLLYGDRWTGPLVLARVGAPDNWATAMLPAALFDLPDFSALYPEASRRPVEAEAYRRVDLQLDPEAQTWEQALTAIARAAEINVLSDAFLRPEVFRPAGKPAPILAGTLAELLDRACAYYGCYWWKAGDYYLFRSRNWADEERAAVPERLLQSLGTALTSGARLPPNDLASLAALSDEQLLTMHLYGSAPGLPVAPPEAFDFNEIQLARNGLTLFAQLDAPQRQLALGAGMPYLAMSPSQQQLFAQLAAERGAADGRAEVDRWSFRVQDQFRRQRHPGGWASVGAVQLLFELGSGGTRAVELAVRAPVVEQEKSP